ncbi:MAG TPA: hypothetical protein VEH27_08085 [Methylomirabilota bacterium]|nr:hypothetical protein [Methylomirabilota bacterium]
MKNQFLVPLTAVALAALTVFVNAADKKPKYTTSEVMEALHKGETNTGKKILQGNGTKEDFAKLVEYYESLPLNPIEKGDKASWEAKTTALLKAAKALNAGEAGALEKYKEAVNCKACHNAHRPEDKK